MPINATYVNKNKGNILQEKKKTTEFSLTFKHSQAFSFLEFINNDTMEVVTSLFGLFPLKKHLLPKSIQ